MSVPIEQATAGHIPAALYQQAVQQAGPGAPAPVIVVQAPAAQQQKPYGPLLLAGVVGGGLVVALLLAVAVVAVAVGIGAVSCTVGWLVIRNLSAKGGK
ncbi:hypothetical protein ABWI13_32260 [Streptomyces koyangensis]|uniref:hypothetical protein n=1 Tax=Streptomyces TaxID=1883 RepID=UPI0006900FA6|nr:hypothetical protein [Streptomyces albidoflavus]CAI4175604.1 hypothetical protein CCOS2040_31370 [Streptomyces albidoflavus]